MGDMDSTSYLGGWAGDPANPHLMDAYYRVGRTGRGKTHLGMSQAPTTLNPDRQPRVVFQFNKPPLRTLLKKRKFRKKREREQNMGLYIVYEVVEEQHEVKPEEYMTSYTPHMLGAFHGNDAGEAITNAVKISRRFGKYVAVEVHPMEIDLTAKQAELTEATAVEEDE